MRRRAVALSWLLVAMAGCAPQDDGGLALPPAPTPGVAETGVGGAGLAAEGAPSATDGVPAKWLDGLVLEAPPAGDTDFVHKTVLGPDVLPDDAGPDLTLDERGGEKIRARDARGLPLETKLAWDVADRSLTLSI
ncbi:MAG TPA: hypothetical protein VG389_00095, partial [Myxococcota bacterium]|nr:hypothetical protein [Myxococcota bacterium]